VIGAGGLGHIAIQLLRVMTATRVIVVDRSADALGLASRLGADVVIPADGSQIGAVRTATGGRGADVILDFVGDEGTPGEAMGMIARRGTYIAVGYGGRLDVPLIDLVASEVTIAGSLIGTHEELVELAGLADRGLVTVTTRTYPLDAIGEAMVDLRAGEIHGRAVIVP
jgi:NAD+-dependent secondary alcohol dehydrogenase Adh1